MKEASGEVGIYTNEKRVPQNTGIAIAMRLRRYLFPLINYLYFRFGVLFLLPVCTGCCSPKSDDVDACGSGSGVQENC